MITRRRLEIVRTTLALVDGYLSMQPPDGVIEHAGVPLTWAALREHIAMAQKAIAPKPPRTRNVPGRRRS